MEAATKWKYAAAKALLEGRSVVGAMCRQSGKTDMIMGMALWKYLFGTTRNILIVAPKFSTVSSLQRQFFDIINRKISLRWINSQNKLDWISGFYDSTATTEPFTDAFVDESAFIPESRMEAILSKRVRDDFQFMMLSTPNAPDDLFANIWKAAQNSNIEKIRVTGNDLGLKRPQWFDSDSRMMKKEWLGEFV